MAEWHDNAEFWAGTGPYIFRELIRGKSAWEVERLVELLGLKPGAEILDMPCGVGRHSIELAKRGFKVTGVDRTKLYLAECRDTAAKLGVSVEWVEGDMREFRRPVAFDAVINMFTSFGYFEDEKEDWKVAAGMFESLRVGGWVLFEMMGKEILSRTFRASDWHEEPDGTIVLEQRSLSRDWSWIENRWVFTKDGKTKEMTFAHRLYDGPQLCSLLEETGFVGVRAYGSLAGAAYDDDAERLVVVGRK